MTITIMTIIIMTIIILTIIIVTSWEADPFIMDERYLAVMVKNKVDDIWDTVMMFVIMVEFCLWKNYLMTMMMVMLVLVMMMIIILVKTILGLNPDQGLVVFSACSHAGIVNVMESATKHLGQK